MLFSTSNNHLHTSLHTSKNHLHTSLHARMPACLRRMGTQNRMATAYWTTVQLLIVVVIFCVADAERVGTNKQSTIAAYAVNRELTGANNEWVNPLFFLMHPNRTRGWKPWRVQVTRISQCGVWNQSIDRTNIIKSHKQNICKAIALLVRFLPPPILCSHGCQHRISWRRHY